MKAVILAALAFMVFGGASAQASVTLLEGSIHITNPAAPWKAPHTINYNSIHGTAATCESAKTEAINAPIAVYPVAATGNFGNFYKVVSLTCTAK